MDVDKEEFSLRFVNKKSHERVIELVDEIKLAFQQQTVEVDPAPSVCLERVDDNPELLFRCPLVKKLRPDPSPPPATPGRLGALRPFLFPFYPAFVPKGEDEDYEISRRSFLTAARLQHERLLWSFQDRLVHNLSVDDDQTQSDPFQTATAHLAREQGLPIHYIEKKSGSWQTRFNALLKKSQKRATALLEAQSREAKFLRETKLFEFHCAQLQKNESASGLDKQFELPVSCPFSFLSESG
jgi:hypothetical protein